MSLARSKTRRAELLICTGLFVLSALIFWGAPVQQIADSNYSMLLSQSLLYHHSFMLDGYAIPRLQPTVQSKWFRKEPYTYNGKETYQIQVIDNHLYYFLPPGTSVLSMPFVALMNAFGISASNADGTFNLNGETVIELSIAAVLMAGLTVIFYLTGRLFLSRRWCTLVALGAALGTQVWSTATRALWSETWGVLLTGIVILMLVRREVGRHRPRPVLLASLLAWMYFVRPANSVPILVVSIYILLFERKIFSLYVITGGVWLAGFVAYSWYHFHDWLPYYYLYAQFGLSTFWVALAGNLISPSRGLLIFVPVVGFVFYLLVRYRRELEHRRLAVLSLAVIFAHLLLISCFSFWVGGASYGPRYSTALVPWFVLLSILGIKAMLAERTADAGKRRSFARRAELAAGGALLFTSVFINAQGAIYQSTYSWNAGPPDVGIAFERVWDWKDPQFLVGIKEHFIDKK
jgi:hypothetical protein